MITFSAKITGMLVTLSMGFFLTAVAVLCVLPLVQAMVEGRRPEWPPLPPIMENLGVAVALAGLTFQVTEVAAVGLGLTLLGAWFSTSRGFGPIHPIFEKAVLVAGVIGVGALGEYYYVMVMA